MGCIGFGEPYRAFAMQPQHENESGNKVKLKYLC